MASLSRLNAFPLGSCIKESDLYEPREVWMRDLSLRDAVKIAHNVKEWEIEIEWDWEIVWKIPAVPGDGEECPDPPWSGTTTSSGSASGKSKCRVSDGYTLESLSCQLPSYDHTFVDPVYSTPTLEWFYPQMAGILKEARTADLFLGGHEYGAPQNFTVPVWVSFPSKQTLDLALASSIEFVGVVVDFSSATDLGITTGTFTEGSLWYVGTLYNADLDPGKPESSACADAAVDSWSATVTAVTVRPLQFFDWEG